MNFEVVQSNCSTKLNSYEIIIHIGVCEAELKSLMKAQLKYKCLNIFCCEDNDVEHLALECVHDRSFCVFLYVFILRSYQYVRFIAASRCMYDGASV